MARRASMPNCARKTCIARANGSLAYCALPDCTGVTGAKECTQPAPNIPPAPDLVRRDFRATAPDRLWVADITYLPTWMGFLYLAIVLDVYSRRIVGWAMDRSPTADLVTRALDMAIGQRRPAAGLIHHSDHRPVRLADTCRGPCRGVRLARRVL